MVVHTGAHNRPKRVKLKKRGHHDGKTRSSANATKRKRAGLFRGYTGGQSVPMLPQNDDANAS